MQLLQLILGLVGIGLLYYGADYLVKGGVRIAAALKVPPVVVGLTLVAFATSAPELVVSINAALAGNGDISLGNVVGSNICNIGLILGLAAVITPMNVHRQILKFDTPVLVISTGLLTAFCLFSKGILRWQALIFLAFFAVFVWKNVRTGLKTPSSPGAQQPQDTPTTSLKLAIVFVIGGVVALVIGAKFFVDAAILIAQFCHIPDAVIGLTVVAVGTSLPELATSAVAAYKGEKDIAVGNVVGSNIFNIIGILGIAPLIQPIAAAGIQAADLALMCAITLMMGVMMITGKIISRLEGAFLLATYIGYVTWLVANTVK